MKKTLITIMSTLFLILTNIMPAIAQTGEFTIYPSFMHGDNKSWIIQNIEQSNNKTEYVTIENLTNKEETISLDLREATEENGSFLPMENHEYKNLGLWINLPETVITLSPYEKRKTPLTISIPKNADPNEYKATILASKTTKDDQNINITTRIGVRIYINVKPTSAIQTNIFNTTKYVDSVFFFLSLVGLFGAIMYNLIHYLENKQYANKKA